MPTLRFRIYFFQLVWLYFLRVDQAKIGYMLQNSFGMKISH